MLTTGHRPDAVSLVLWELGAGPVSGNKLAIGFGMAAGILYLVHHMLVKTCPPHAPPAPAPVVVLVVVPPPAPPLPPQSAAQ